MKRSFLMCLVLAASACQSYSPVSVAAAPAGAHARVALTDSGSRYVAPLIGSRAEELEGTISQADNAGLTLTVLQVTRAGGSTELGEGQTVRLPADLIASVQTQSTSVARSVLLGGAIVAGSVLAGRSLGGGSGSTLKGGGPVVSGR